jgi:hypothetical protein
MYKSSNKLNETDKQKNFKGRFPKMFNTSIVIYREYLDLKEKKLTGWWRKLHNEELHNLYSSPNTIY